MSLVSTHSTFISKVDLALEVEFSLPEFLRKKFCICEQAIEINKYRKANFFKKLFLQNPDLSAERIVKYLDKNEVRINSDCFLLQGQRNEFYSRSSGDRARRANYLMVDWLLDVIRDHSSVESSFCGISKKMKCVNVLHCGHNKISGTQKIYPRHYGPGLTLLKSAFNMHLTDF